MRGDATALSVTARWGRYSREKSATLTTEKGNPHAVWKQIPAGGKAVSVSLRAGEIHSMALDPAQPEVILHGRIRKLADDWVVSLFLVNAQPMSSRNPKDDELLFQPELEVASADGAAVFQKRRPAAGSNGEGVAFDERRQLAMLYRRLVEFAVGHGVAVHAETHGDDATLAVRLATRVMPIYECP